MFSRKAVELGAAVRVAMPSAVILVNADKPRRGYFEVKIGSQVVFSLPTLQRPFKALREKSMLDVRTPKYGSIAAIRPISSCCTPNAIFPFQVAADVVAILSESCSSRSEVAPTASSRDVVAPPAGPVKVAHSSKKAKAAPATTTRIQHEKASIKDVVAPLAGRKRARE